MSVAEYASDSSHGLIDTSVNATPAIRLHSSLRCCPLEQTFDRASRLLSSLGIARVTDITRMDRLGLPVFASIRPRGLALCVNAGKGLVPAEARVGALMEAVEYAAAEPGRSHWTCRTMRLGELQGRWPRDVDLSLFAPRVGADLGADCLVETIACEDAAGRGQPIEVPAELVFVPWERCQGPAIFGWSTNGLASGNSLSEATLHGLLEVLERDALALNSPRDGSLWLAPTELPAPFDRIFEGWRQHGFDLSVRHVPNAFGLPCFRVLIQGTAGDAVGLAEGSALHFDALVALTRAITEAAQSRLSHIHGGRDDITRYYAKRGDEHAEPTDPRSTLAYREAFDSSRRITWDRIPSIPCDGFAIDELLSQLMKRLEQGGLARVLRHRFDLDLGGLHVVKVIVPGCETAETPLRAGPRLRQRVMADD